MHHKDGKGLTAEACRSLQSCAAGRSGGRLTPVDVALLSGHLAGGVPGGHIQDADLGQDLQCYDCHVSSRYEMPCCTCHAAADHSQRSTTALSRTEGIRMPATAVMAVRPFSSSACWYLQR
jgi:hypothetical protein